MRSSLLWELLVSQRLLFGLVLLTVFVTGGLTLVIAQQLVQMVDRGIVDQAVPLGGYVRTICILAAISAAFSFVQSQAGSAIAYRVEYALRIRLYEAIHSSSLRRLDRVATGQLVTRALTDLTMIESSMRIIPLVVAWLPLILGMGIYLLISSPLIGAVALGALPLNLWLVSRFSGRLRALTWAELNERADIASAIDEPVKGIRVVRAFGREDFERGRVAEVARNTFKFGMTRWRLLARFDIPMKAAPIVAQLTVVGVGASLVAADNLSLGTFVLAFQLVSSMLTIANYASEIASLWQYANTSQHRVSEVLALGGAERTEGTALLPAGSGIALRDVHVRLGGRDVLAGIDLAVAPGELVAVIGGPGSGKSTLAGVASGLVQPDRGEVQLDHTDLAEVDPSELHRAVRVVSEDAYLFSFSIRQNLELACDGRADDDSLRRALAAAGADDFVDDLPLGINTPLGDRGLTVSGGQRQRLALARALIEPPRVLLLDDALSAVNPSMEAEILRRVREASPDTAIIVLSRRRSAVSVADRVVELPPPDLTAVPGVDSTQPAVAGSELAIGEDVLAVLRELHLADDEPEAGDSEAVVDAPARVRELAAIFRVPLAVALGALLLQTVGAFAPEIALGNIADLVEDGERGALVLRGLLLLVAGVLAVTGAYLLRVYSQRVTQGVMYLLRRRVFQRLTRLGINHYDRELPGDVAARIVFDLDQLAIFLQGTVFTAVQDVAKVVVSLVIVSLLAPTVIPVFVVAAVVILGMAAVQLRVNTRAFDRARDELGGVVSIFEEDAAGRNDIRAFGALARATSRFRDQAGRLRRARRHATLLQNGFSSILGNLSHVIAAFVLYRAGGLVLAGAASVGSALTVRLLTSSGTQPLSGLTSTYAELLKNRVSWQRLQEPFDVPIHPAPDPTAVACGPLEGAVAFESVAFAYPETSRRILHDVSFSLAPGSVTALVGFTGAGKSSIAKLLMRTYDPDEGVVRVDGADLRSVAYDTYRSQIGVVPQDAFLFRGTVRSNIAYGKLDATDADVEAAARAVGAHEVLAALPRGYDHVVEEEARNLTAAQRQLIALARAWIAEPALLVLDEATSCLDAELEQRVLEAVRTLDCTTLTVTHRDNVAASCDHVIVLDAGRVVEEGAPEALVGAGGAFDRLWVVEPPTPREAITGA
jgi:ATP-binding cassette subfamily B protein